MMRIKTPQISINRIHALGETADITVGKCTYTANAKTNRNIRFYYAATKNMIMVCIKKIFPQKK